MEKDEKMTNIQLESEDILHKKRIQKNLQKYVRQTFDRKNGTEKLMLKKLLSNWCLTVNIRCTKKMSKKPLRKLL